MKQFASAATKRALRVACLLFAVACSAAGASAQSADKTIQRAVKSMTAGKGEKALREIKSWEIRGTITNAKDGGGGAYRALAAQPGLYATTYDLRGVEVSVGFNGKSVWARDSRGGLRTLTGAESRDFQTEARYRNVRWLDYKKEKSRLTYEGQSKVDGKAVNAVVLTTPKNVKIKMYFDAASGLLTREEVPAGESPRVFEYADFRPVDGVMEPYFIRITSGEERYEIKLDQVSHNPQVDRAAFEFPKLSNEPLPDIPALLKQVGENEDEIDRLLEKYTYTETITEREIDSNGQMKSKETKTYELTFYKGNRIRRLTSKDGKPLNPKEEAEEQKDVEKRIREIEKKETEKERKAQKDREVAQDKSGSPDGERGQRISIADVLRASKLINPRRESFRGREVIVFDFEPAPGYKPQKDYEKFFGKMAGAIWVAPDEKQVARVEARLIEPYKVGGGVLASLKEGANFVLEADRINQEIWLPTRAEINLGVRVLLVKGFNINQTISYGDYKRFNVDAEKEKLKDPTQSEKTQKP
jgi:outer membrane lipoprotein-sorting protein